MKAATVRYFVFFLILVPGVLAAQGAHAGVWLAWAWGGAPEWHVRYVDSIGSSDTDAIGHVVTTGEITLKPEQCDLTPVVHPCILRIMDAGGIVRLTVGAHDASSRYFGGGSTRLAATSAGDWHVVDSEPDDSLDPSWAVQILSSILPLRWPERSLHVGDTWTFKWTSARLGVFQTIDRLDAQARLDSIVDRLGKRSAWISIAGRGPSWMNYRGGMATDAQVTADVEWDLCLGGPVAVTVRRRSVGVRASGIRKGQAYTFDEIDTATIGVSPSPQNAIP